MIPDPLPFGAAIGEDGIWRQLLTRVTGVNPRPALFLDRDGVIVEEVHYLHRIKDMKVMPGAADVIGRANRAGVPVVVVTNQAGIGRGKYGWKEFIAVQDAMLDELASAGAYVNAVFACPHHAEGVAPYDIADHPARKPNPGMLLAAAELLPTLVRGNAYWTVVQTVNFRFVPPQCMVLFGNLASCVWTTYLCIVANRAAGDSSRNS